MFEAIFDRSPVPCAILVRGQCLSHCNHAFARLLGYRRDELLDQPLHPLVENTAELVTISYREGEVASLQFKHKRGQVLTLQCSTAPLNPGLEPAGTILQVMEISSRNATLSHSVFQSVTTLADLAIDHVREAVYLIGDNGRILDTNKAACDTLGYSREELVQLSVSDIDPHFVRIPGYIEMVGKSRQSLPILDTYHQRKNGELFPVKVSAVIVQRDGNTYLLAFALDMSEEMRLEDMRLGILESLARGDSEQQSLQLIVDCVEAMYPKATVSIMRVNDEGTHLIPCPFSKLPSRYLDAINFVPIGEGNGACGTAAALSQTVQVEDIATHPYFEAYRNVARDAGLMSCLSVPILRPEGGVLGTFCVYLSSATSQPSEVGVEMSARRAGYFTSIALERHRAEQRIQESQQRYRDIFDNSLDALALLEVTEDRHFRTLEANPAMEKMVGIARDRMVGRTLEEVVPPEVAAKTTAKYRACLDSGGVIERELELELPVGKRTFHSTLIPVRCPEGTFYRIVAITRDVTDHREAEKLLHAREQEFRALVEHSPDGIIRYNRQGKPSYVNPAMQRILGNIQGRVQGSWMVSQDEQDYSRALESALASGSESRLMVRWTGTGSLVRYGDVHFVPEFTPDGEVCSVLTVNRDVTALKETENQLRTLVESQKAIDIELRESRSLLRELGNRRESELEAERKRIAHEIHDELGQLLTTLRINLSLVGAQLRPGNEGLQERLSDMTKLVDRTIQTVRNIATSLRPAVLNAGIVSALEWLTEEFSRHTGIQCHLDINDGVQLNEERAIVIFRVVQESLSNVGRHSGATQVWIHLHRSERAFNLIISDNGCGFDPDSKANRQSFGLMGMRERALSLAGTLGLSSSPGSGTVLRLSIPIQQTDCL